MSGPALVAFALESAICALLVLFAVFLVSTRRRHAASLYLLAALSGALALMLAANVLIATLGWRWLADGVLFVDLPTPALVFGYVRQVRLSPPPVRRWEGLHALPALAGLGLWKTGAVGSMDIYVIGVWTIYLVLAGLYAWRHREAYPHRALSVFVVSLLATMAAVTLLRIAMAVDANSGRAFQEGVPYLAVLLAVLLAACQIVFVSLRYPEVLSIPGAGVKYGAKTSDAAEDTRLVERIEALFQAARPYSDPDFSVAELASRLDVPPRRVSQLINQRYGMNVSAWLNTRRVEDAAGRLRAQPDAAIKVVMYETGFRSKSNFNREFQRRFGASPSVYRRETGGKG